MLSSKRVFGEERFGEQCTFWTQSCPQQEYPPTKEASTTAVGDVVTAQEIYLKMHNFGLEPDETTVHAIVDGLLNAGDSHGSITVVQDFFNQHSVLPPLWMHYKILELCLGQGLAYEAKRYVYFIQQLWKWEPNQYHDPKFVETMRAVQKSPGLQKEALQKLFAYFGEELKDSDFF
eukprot:CAMPEP_0168862890 /NCGR_PEP_ID=MMETSP0727-20121128/18670_1 /TAXON_ID=265536 /ORGANISM="Amphiprora sp., Strain CCMP467" /LENGTH=175 /DNA_ID=CAMNT_0008917947 /DNA_START=27 /DNA_END=554 /DNA_ORIENTATION=+